MSSEEIISDFITYNGSIFNQIQEENEELSNALGMVIKELFAKYTGIDISQATTQDAKLPNYKLGEEVETISGEWDGVAVIEKAVYDDKEDSWIYYVKQGRNKFKDLEANIFTPIADKGSDYAKMTLEQLQDELETQKELVELYDDPTDPEQIEAESKILEIELEIESRK
jgi:hypothetical protein